MKHTTGPWEIIKAPNGHVYIRDSLGAEIAQMGSENMLADDSSAAKNARLIAAAPGLLAALELLANGCTRVIGQDSTGQDMVKIRAAAIYEARAVIAQATGEKA